MSLKQMIGFTFKTLAVAVAILVITIVVSAVALPTETVEASPAEGGSVMVRLFIVCLVDALVLGLAITSSRWRGVPLIVGLVFAFYGVQTVIGQIEAVVFLTPLGERFGAGSIPALMMPIDFIMGQFYIGAAQAGLGIPLAVLLFGKAKREGKDAGPSLNPGIRGAQWIWKLGAIIVSYELLYFGFGYYVAWKDPAVLAFYQGTDPGSFLAQMRHVATQTPTLIPFQALRALLWTAFALPVIAMLRHKPRLGALITGLFLSLPMNIPHLVPNPFMPPAVRMAHFIETVSSTFIFGLLMFWLLHRSHRSLKDLLGVADRGEIVGQAEMQTAS
jgi:hypothetical protein